MEIGVDNLRVAVKMAKNGIGGIQFPQIIYWANLIEALTQNNIFKTQIAIFKTKNSNTNLIQETSTVCVQCFPTPIMKEPLLICYGQGENVTVKKCLIKHIGKG